ncbi:TonB-dependent receptor [Persephonella sp.]
MKKLLYAALAVPVMFSISEAQILKVKKITVAEEVTEAETKGETKEVFEEDIKITRQIDIGEILSNLFPEINHIRKGGTANDIVIRGFGRDNINVLVDGARIYGACPNRMDPPIFHMSTPQIKEVQILEGPFDVSNQGSLAGTVNLVSKDPEAGFGGSVGFTGGSFSYMSGNLQVYGGNDKIKALFGFSRQYSKPYESGEGKKFTEYPTGKSAYKSDEKDHTAFDITNVWGKIAFTINPENELKIGYAYDNFEDVLYPYLMMDAVYDRTHRANIDYINRSLGVKVSAYWNTVEHDMQDRWRVSSIEWTDGTKSTRGYMMKTLAETETYGFKVEKEYKLDMVRIKTGIDGYLRNWTADNELMALDNSGMIPDVDIRNLGIFVKGDKKINNLIISAGLRYDNTKSEADKNSLGTANSGIYDQYYTNYDLSETDSYLSGNIIARYKIDKRSSVYLGFGHTVRVPDPAERYIALKKPDPSAMTPDDVPDWVGNPNLKPVKNNEIDAGFEFYKGVFGIKGNLFYSKLKDYIYLIKIKDNTGTLNAVSYQNIDAHIYGGDITLLGMLTDTVSLEVGAAYQKGKKDSGTYTDDDLAEIPPLKSRIAVKYDNDSFYGLVETIYAAKQEYIDEDLGEQVTKSYFVVNIKGGFNLGERVFVGGGIDNIFDKNYYTHLSYLRNPFMAGTKIPEPGRFYYVNFNWVF